MSHPTGTSSCDTCGAPLPRDRRRRYCDDCREQSQPIPVEFRPRVVDFTKALQAKACQCQRPMLYEDDGDHHCAACGRAAVSVIVEAA